MSEIESFYFNPTKREQTRIFKRALILAPHTDDGELGAGGTIAKLIESGTEVYYVAFSTAEESVPDYLPKDILKTEVKKATKYLGIKPENLIIYDYKVRMLQSSRQNILDNLIKLRNSINPDVIFCPSTTDIHQDHKTITDEAIRAFKHVTILGYEMPWNNIEFKPGLFVNLTGEQLSKKCESLQKYESQTNRNYMTQVFNKSLAIMRGVQSGCTFTESFEIIRMIL